MGTRLPALLLAGLAFSAGPIHAQQSRAEGTATIRIPLLLSFRVLDEPTDGEASTIVLVRANQDWRLTVRQGRDRIVVEGGPGRDQRYVLDPSLLDDRRGRLEITLTAR